ncbi:MULTISPECIES: Hansenula MRAKII killer toxin-resistant protein 1 [unclassified Actinoplanes]|uniref:Hansenula MRAKII killer toxin-resistant protein 1 n=1 Tax=unclassified Actinoplanes TaxID=2626549 RepID=UPI0005B9A559|nr:MULTISPECIES: Hansenula MRAKII killer toxin-resistant protein 1 [unclassified Actinoplanes]SLL96853.1 hypothetical protein ACSP50_0040 [Actinoplanes sp. SE50/110]
MADKGWTAQAAAAAGIAAGAGAAQLGLGYGLGVIEWPATATATDSTWLNSLGWATWITASATVLGAVIAGRLRADRAGRWRTLWRIALAAAAALGALVSVALVALPARSAAQTPLFTHSPQLVAVSYSLIGLLAGVIVAFWAVSSAPVAANLVGTAAWLWALAIAGVTAELSTNRNLETYLTSWQFAEDQTPVRYGGIYWPSALLTLAAAFAIGLVAAWPAARRGRLGLGTATSGAVGPLLVAVAFLALAPLLTQAAGPLQSAYLMAPYAVLAGLAGSALTVSLGRSRGRAAASGPLTEPTGGPAAAALPAAPSAPASSASSATSAVSAAPSEPSATRSASSATRSASSATRSVAPAAPSVASAPSIAPSAAPSVPESAPRGRWSPFGRKRPAEEPAAPATQKPAEKPTAQPAEKPAPKSAAKPTGKTAPKPVEPLTAGLADPELAAAARSSKATKRTPTRKEPRSTITPPPANPPIARINPDS